MVERLIMGSIFHHNINDFKRSSDSKHHPGSKILTDTPGEIRLRAAC
ncbi:hypothetical protein FHW17_003086 [Phyllobacterium sp. P30BS-XVII]|nr:hypothetical protein [Phyllobacterium sp. P30BS-XVII]